MNRSRRRAAAVAGTSLAIAAAACGVGPGAEVGGVGLTISRDYGRGPSTEEQVPGVRQSDTVMRILDRRADIDTRYGGKFVQSIDGVQGGQAEGRPHDWFFYVNGVESETGASDYRVADGDQIWWDYRDWGSAQAVPAVVGAWPEPFIHGYGDQAASVSVRCDTRASAACGETRRALRDIGAKLVGNDGAIRVLVGTWGFVRSDPAARGIEAGPETSGVFADFKRIPAGYSLVALSSQGEPAEALGADAGLLAATRRYGGPPTWVITGGTARAARAAAGLLRGDGPRGFYALAAGADGKVGLPDR